MAKSRERVIKMMNEIINAGEEVRITSVDLVVEINKFRKEESELSNGRYVELPHKDFMKKVRKELKVLETLGLGGEGNISPSSYVNSQNKEQPCFSLNRDGVLQMLNSESVLVRYKTIERLKELEEECKVLNTIIDNTSDENAKLERNKFRFSVKRTIGTFANCETLKLPELYGEFSEYILSLDTDTRLSRYMSALKGVSKMIETLSGELIYVLPIAQKVQYDIKSDMETLRNRQNGGIKAYQTKQIAEKNRIIEGLSPSDDKYITINYHGLSNNDMYDNKHRTWKYNKWIKEFPSCQVPPKGYWEDIDFTKPVKLYLKFKVVSERYDIPNMQKSIQDQLFNREMKIDDNIVKQVVCEHDGLCESFDEATIKFYIMNA